MTVTARVAAVPKPLKVRITDAEDLSVTSAYLQDALLPIGDMCYRPAERRFVAVVNRFRWEVGPPGGEGAQAWQRVLCGLRFEQVTRVQSSGLDFADRGQILEILALERTDDAVVIHFAGGPAVRIELDGLAAFAEDLGEPWPTGCCPHHAIEPMEAPKA